MKLRMLAAVLVLLLAVSACQNSPTAATTAPDEARYEGTGYMGGGK